MKERKLNAAEMSTLIRAEEPKLVKQQENGHRMRKVGHFIKVCPNLLKFIYFTKNKSYR